MSTGAVWFGTPEAMQWVPAPKVDVNTTYNGSTFSAQFMNGGAWVRRSKSGARSFALSWNLASREAIQPIIDYAHGHYGEGLIYYLNPFAMPYNVLPPYWATPYLNTLDGPVIIADERPASHKVTAPQAGLPLHAADYTVTSSGDKPKVYIPVPKGHTAYISGVWETLSGDASLRVIPTVDGITPGTTTNLPDSTALPMTTQHTVSGDTQSGFWLTFFSPGTGVLRVHGVQVKVLPTGAVPSYERFNAGLGTSGLAFTEVPSVSEYSAALNKVGVSANLLEVGAWL